MIAKHVTIDNDAGLHLRVAGEIVRLSRSSKTSVRLVRGDDMREANGDSIINLLLLEADRGVTLHVAADGPGEMHILERIEELFSEGGGI